MTVSELIQWLQQFPDQGAEVEVIRHSSDGGYYCQGGTVSVVSFDPSVHAEYTDLRDNPHVKPTDKYFGQRTLLLGGFNT
jgi:putative lipoic acid-binding regulatory protein